MTTGIFIMLPLVFYVMVKDLWKNENIVKELPVEVCTKSH